MQHAEHAVAAPCSASGYSGNALPVVSSSSLVYLECSFQHQDLVASHAELAITRTVLCFCGQKTFEVGLIEDDEMQRLSLHPQAWLHGASIDCHETLDAGK